MHDAWPLSDPPDLFHEPMGQETAQHLQGSGFTLSKLVERNSTVGIMWLERCTYRSEPSKVIRQIVSGSQVCIPLDRFKSS